MQEKLIRDISINYLILAHKNLEQIDLMIEMLSNENTYFYIHIDKKVNMKEIRIRKFFFNEKVKLVKRRLSVNWGGFNMIAATLLMMKMASSENKKSYYILLSGQDLPVISNEDIYNRLIADYGVEYIDNEVFPKKAWYDGGFDRIGYYWFIDKLGMHKSYSIFLNQKNAGNGRVYFEDFTPFGGSQWWCLTYECVRYVLTFLAKNPIVIDYFEHTLIPDEMFFQTIIMNSHFKERVINDNLRYIHFEKDGDNPVILGDEHYSFLLDPKYLWARKFDITVSPDMIKYVKGLIKTK